MLGQMTFLRLKHFFAWFSQVHPIFTIHFVTTICWKTIRTGIVPFVKHVTSGELGIATNATNVKCGFVCFEMAVFIIFCFSISCRYLRSELTV